MFKGLIITLVLYLSIFFELFAQNLESRLYFIASNPEMHLDEDVYFSFLYKCSDSVLVVQDTLTSGKYMFSRFIRVYPERGVSFYFEESLIDPKQNRLLAIKHSDPKNKNILDNIDDEVNPWPVSLVLDNKLYFNLNEKITNNDIFYSGYSESLERRFLQPIDFKNSYMSGSPGAPIKNVDKQLLVSNKENGKLSIPVTRDVAQRPYFSVELPEKYWIRENKRLVVYINTDDILLIKVSAIENHNDKLGECLFLLKDKSADKWSELKVAGNQTRVQAFGKWISGSIVDKDNSKKKVSPGMNLRNFSNDYNPGFDVMTHVLGLFYPGRLFIYNIEANNYIEWKTDQGDSEILLIENDIVIYRVGDAIYKMPIINNSKIGKSKLIIRDLRATSIHWAFTSPLPQD